MALAAAQALNCTNPQREPSFDACGVCASCTRIARQVHADVAMLAPGENGSIKIEEVRDLVERSAYRPFEGRCRVAIVDDADALLPAAQNALLKTLEEPPSSSVFLLVTARPDLLLPTVRSRCPQLRFRPLAADDVSAVLVTMGRQGAEARAIAAAADGSVGHALDASAEELIAARDTALRVLTEASRGDARRRVEEAKALLPKTSGGAAADRVHLATHLRAMASLLRDAELVAAGGRGELLANPDVQPAVERLSEYRGERGVRAFAAIGEALTAIERNAGVKLVADWLVVNL